MARKKVENMDYNELRSAAADAGLDATGTADQLRARLNGEEEPVADDKPREATQNVNPDGSRKPTENELRSAVQGFKAEMLRDGASEEDVNKALKEAEAYSPPAVYEVNGGNQGGLTPYTTPSVYSVAGPPKGGDIPTPEGKAEAHGGTAKEAVAS